MRFRLRDVDPVPDVFAAVMATGIVSVAAEDHRYLWISNLLAGVGILTLVVLTAMVLMETIVAQRFPYDLREPDIVVRLYTFVAACAVLGARFEAHPAETWALAAIAWLGWLVLLPVIVRAMRPHRWSSWRDRGHGVWEVVSVATSGLAIVTAHLALLASDSVLFGVGVATWLLAICLYAAVTWLILWRVAAAPNEDIWRPDSWILMGGLAIATLAGDHLHRVGVTIGVGDWLLEAMRLVTILTWVLATLWIPLLVYTTVRYLRLRFTGAWWAMVFPIGMYSSATFAMSIETAWQAFATVSMVVFWIALTAWLIVAVAAVCQLSRIPGNPTA
jgi:tellurite resistance protein TehA-like permease